MSAANELATEIVYAMQTFMRYGLHNNNNNNKNQHIDLKQTCFRPVLYV